VFLSEITNLWKIGKLPLDVALLQVNFVIKFMNIVHLLTILFQVSPPDRHGWCSLGVSVDVSLSAMQHARRVIAIINPQMPRTHGEGVVHISRLDSVCHIDTPILTSEESAPTEAERNVGRNVAKLIPEYVIEREYVTLFCFLFLNPVALLYKWVLETFQILSWLSSRFDRLVVLFSMFVK
jgi:hypothetical protein